MAAGITTAMMMAPAMTEMVITAVTTVVAAAVMNAAAKIATAKVVTVAIIGSRNCSKIDIGNSSMKHH